jgi:DNA (cytosine-5)-methyltransferase 1
MGPKLLDLFRGEGGASYGYHLAGWDVYAVDLKATMLRRGTASGVHVGDALAVLGVLIAGGRVDFTLRDGSVVWLGLEDFHAIHTSPPCQGYTIATAGNLLARAKHQRLIAATRELLKLTGKPWVIENVEQARSQMNGPILLCGRMFGLTTLDEDGLGLWLTRHRLFESNVPLMSTAHPRHRKQDQIAGVYGGSRRAKRLPGETLAEVAPRDRHAARYERHGGYVPRSIHVQQELLGIDWMTVKGMQESIPPVYAQHVGRQLLAHVAERAA